MIGELSLKVNLTIYIVTVCIYYMYRFSKSVQLVIHMYKHYMNICNITKCNSYTTRMIITVVLTLKILACETPNHNDHLTRPFSGLRIQDYHIPQKLTGKILMDSILGYLYFVHFKLPTLEVSPMLWAP